jgi:hypothetical protein
LERVGCDAVAALTQRVIEAMKVHPLTVRALEESALKPDVERDRALHAVDKQFYAIFEIEPKLFAFVESLAQGFVLGKMEVAPRPPRRGNRNLIALGVGLAFAPKTERALTERTFEAVRRLAVEIAIQKEIEPAESELDGAAYLYLFRSCLKTGELEQCEAFAGPAFELTREDTSHCVAQREWVEKLMERSNFLRADEVTLEYLEYLSGEDGSVDFIKNRIKYWADPMRRHPAGLPRSCEFFRAKFPGVSL